MVMVPNKNNLDEIEDTDIKRTIIRIFQWFKENTSKHRNEMKADRMHS